MLIILKLFKLKLLLFLPLILGLASFKKLLGFLAIIIPGLIGFFKLCKPNLQSPFSGGNHYAPHYSQAGVGYHPLYKEGPSFADDYSGGYYGDDNNRQLTFRDRPQQAQDLAYSGYSQYRNSGRQIASGAETSTKSILPDS